MVENALGGNVVKRLCIAGSAAAVRFGDVVRGRLGRRIGQGEGAEQISTRPRTQIVRRAPDFLRPIDRFSSLIEYRAHLHNHRRCLRLVDKFFLAAPAHTNGPTGLLHGDNRRIGGSIVRPIVAVTAGTLHVVHNDRGRVELEDFGQGSPQRVYALAMRPNGQFAVLAEGKPTGWRDRGVSEIAARVGSFEALPALGIRRRGPERAVNCGPLQQPAGLLLRWCRCLEVVPNHVTDGGTGCRVDSSLIVADDSQKVAVANEFDRSLCGAANGSFVDRGNGCTTVGLPDNAGVNRSVELHVVNENTVAEYFFR